MTEQEVRISLLELGFRDDSTNVRLSIVWDREARRFDFVGDTELVTPAARQFFEEVCACAMDKMKEYFV